MWKRLMRISVLVVGAGLTTSCAGFGLARLLAIVSGPSGPQRTGRPASELKTVLIRVENVDVEEVAEFVRKYKSDRGQVGVNQTEQLVRITDLPQSIARLKRVIAEVDQPLRPNLPVRPIHGPCR